MNTKKILASIAIAMTLSLATAWAAQTDCPAHYADGIAPDITSQPLSQKARELCFSAFAVMHSGISRTPLWSAEHLTSANVQKARTLQRKDTFHAETRLPAAERAELADYSRSGYDRGHQSPNADMPDATAQQESFSLSNTVPQDPGNNRGVWSDLESAARKYAERNGDIFIITGPLFIGDNIGQINGRVLIPTHIYKVVYDANRKKAAAYLAKNEPHSTCTTLTVSQLEEMAGINFFPGMATQAKQHATDILQPQSRAKRSHTKGRKISLYNMIFR